MNTTSENWKETHDHKRRMRSVFDDDFSDSICSECGVIFEAESFDDELCEDCDSKKNEYINDYEN